MKKLTELLLKVEKRPEMYIGDHDLFRLAMFVNGYEGALLMHNITNDVCNFNAEFNMFVYRQKGWSTSCGWAHAISSKTSDKKEALAAFFELYKKFLDDRETIEVVEPAKTGL